MLVQNTNAKCLLGMRVSKWVYLLEIVHRGKSEIALRTAQRLPLYRIFINVSFSVQF